MKILFIGDIFGSSGRSVLATNLKKIIEEQSIDLVIANAENSAHGKGITEKIYRQLSSYGINFFTMGNHTWAKKEGLPVLEMSNVVRPHNLKEEFAHSNIGLGSKLFVCKGLKIRITNLLGNSVYFKHMQENVFVSMKNLLEAVDKPDVHIVDLHAETTSEKYAFLWAFNGQVDAILGTHTHVPTNDACITKEGTAFVCDVGMTGPAHGVIGGKKDEIINKFFNPSVSFTLEVQKGPKQLCSVILEFDEDKKRMSKITPLIIREGFEWLGKSNIY
ncbi:TIGR00282 family metallophosphoesterase [Candidatus Mycoplasma haematohominis]|uniref:TIGR00282 family metallophosphoesterase n=1 Tax=Candidatus Mycoplasma haematohominis TaxID=1494318 RepID=UPI001C0A69A9|nr:TIGR00282 family metallophosphoesterase [Candidatus Mycoplasma haemohominis]